MMNICLIDQFGDTSEGRFLIVRLDYEDTVLYYSCRGCAEERPSTRVPVAQQITPGDYRPCISVSHNFIRLGVVVDDCKRKRARDDDIMPALKMNKTLWSSKDFTDAVVAANGVDFPVHRCVLVAASAFFDKAFKTPMREGQNARIDIDNYEASVVEILLRFLYTGEIGNDENKHAAALLSLAHQLEVSHLVEHCAAKLVENVCERNVARTVGSLRNLRDCSDLHSHWNDLTGKIASDPKLVAALMVGDADSAETRDSAT